MTDDPREPVTLLQRLDEPLEPGLRKSVTLLRGFAELERNKPKRIVFDFFAKPLRVEGDDRAERIIVERTELDENGAACPQVIDDGLVVDDFVADVNRPVVVWQSIVQRQLDGADRPLDASAKSTRRGEQHAEGHRFHSELSSSHAATIRHVAVRRARDRRR